MAKKIEIVPGEWLEEKNRLRYAKELERGNILFFAKNPFEFPASDQTFLLSQRQSGSKKRKNIAYKPELDKITNHETEDATEKEQMKQALRNYSSQVATFLTTLLPSYAASWKLDYASFRPFQEKGRSLRMRARNDLLHVDAFPTRPLNGSRILRFFTNINPAESRKWITSKPFGELAHDFAGEKGVPFPASADGSLKSRFERTVKELLRKAGVKIPLRSPYDRFMLKMHNFLKQNELFQKTCPKDAWDFPPGSCWIVFTDLVSHAALSGQYALEQTLIIPQKTLLFPELSPVSILERLCNRNMVDPTLSKV